MIITEIFEGDQNRVLKNIQHDEYGRSIGRMFESARSELIHADAVLATNLPIVEQAKAVKNFDHRVLQDAHDIIAAAYRFRHDDSCQLQLLESIDIQTIRYLRDWTSWLGDQLEELVRRPLFVRATVEAVLFANTDIGCKAENRLCDSLLTHFSAGDWMSGGKYLKVYKPEQY
jgi:hypothetical protein